MLTNKYICIFSSSSSQIDEQFFTSAAQMAKLLAEQKATLVFGGGQQGLMGETATIFKKHGARVISVIPEKLALEDVVFGDSDKMMKTKTMNERKKIMEEISDGFIALPGGFGTLEEILEIITLKQLGYHHKPIAILNTAGFYDHLIQQLEVLYQKQFAKEECKELYFISDDPGAILDYLIHYDETHTKDRAYF